MPITEHRECYNTTIPAYSIMPEDPEHNCMLWKDDHQENAYFSNVAMRKIMNYVITGALVFYTYQYLQSDVFAGHNVDSVLYVGLTAMPVVMIAGNVPLGFIDSVYYTIGADLIANFTKDVNNLIAFLLHIPSTLKDFVIGSSKILGDVSTDEDISNRHTHLGAEEQKCEVEGNMTESFTI